MRTSTARGLWSLVLLGALLLTSQVRAEDSYAAVAIQNRKYDATAEIDAFIGILPLDAFTKGVTLGGSYTHHFNDLWAWEVAHGMYSFQFDTDLVEDLDNLSVGPTPFEVLEWAVTTNAVLKPLYWKGALSNKILLHGEILMMLGGGLGSFTSSRRAVVDFGVAFRFYLHELISVRLDARHHMFFEDSITDSLSLHHELWVALGLALSF